MEWPAGGEAIVIQSYKHDGTLHRTWESSVVLKGTSSEVICGNDHILVTESDGRRWRTREPAIVFFSSRKWFNIICMIRDDGTHYYCNLGSPFTWDDEALKYIDYDLDIKVLPDMSYKLLDEDEYSLHRRKMHYPQKLDHVLRNHVNELIHWIETRKGPFRPGFVEKWYERFKAFQ